MTERTWIHTMDAQRHFGAYAKSSARLGHLVPVRFRGTARRLGYLRGYGYFLVGS